MVELMRERSWDCRIVDMAPLVCPGGEGKRTLPKVPPPDLDSA
jgi:hypothetical protein